MKKFKNIYIEITNICNLNCSFCPKTERAARSMTAAEFSHVLDKVLARTEYIYLHVVGEPLLCPDIDSILSLCDEKNAKVKLTTNGTLLEASVEMLTRHKSVKAVNISLSCMKDFDSETAQNYLDSSIHAAKLLSKINITVTLRTWVNTAYNQMIYKIISDKFNIKPILEHEQEQDSPAISPPIDVTQGQDSLTKPLFKRGIQRLAERILFDVDSEFVWPVQSVAEKNLQNNCLALKKQLAILSDGTVVPCCLDSEGKLNLGNIFNNTLEQILSSERAVRISHGFQNSQAVEPFCQSCTFASIRL